MNKRNFISLAALTACGVDVRAQDPYPRKTITFIVPAVAGGMVDVLARSLAEEMGKSMGQAIIVDNKPGAASMLGTQYVARSAPDGYTVMITHSGPVMTAPYLFTKVPYDVQRDLTLVSQLCVGQLVLAVNSAVVPAKTVKEFMAWAEANKGKVNYGSFGIGSSGHLMSHHLDDSRKLDMVHVAYKGEAPMLQDLIGGQIAWAIASTGSLLPHVASGRVRVLAVMGDKRVVDMPKVPTMAESGFPEKEYKSGGWVGMIGPAKMPASVLARLEHEARAAVQTTAMKARFQSFGMEALGSTSAEFKSDYALNAPISERMVKASGIQID